MARRSTIHPNDEQTKDSSVKTSTRERIVSPARQHFFAYGFRRVTMDHLGHELGISKKTLYTHFLSKAALMEAVLLDKFRDVEADLERITSVSSSDFSAAFGQLLECMQKHIGIPLMQLILFGYVINFDPKHLPAALLLADDGPESCYGYHVFYCDEEPAPSGPDGILLFFA